MPGSSGTKARHIDSPKLLAINVPRDAFRETPTASKVAPRKPRSVSRRSDERGNGATRLASLSRG
jgi:hypothetical protein